jgi:hypothetical protein
MIQFNEETVSLSKYTTYHINLGFKPDGETIKHGLANSFGQMK